MTGGWGRRGEREVGLENQLDYVLQNLLVLGDEFKFYSKHVMRPLVGF